MPSSARLGSVAQGLRLAFLLLRSWSSPPVAIVAHGPRPGLSGRGLRYSRLDRMPVRKRTCFPLKCLQEGLPHLCPCPLCRNTAVPSQIFSTSPRRDPFQLVAQRIAERPGPVCMNPITMMDVENGVSLQAQIAALLTAAVIAFPPCQRSGQPPVQRRPCPPRTGGAPSPSICRQTQGLARKRCQIHKPRPTLSYRRDFL